MPSILDPIPNNPFYFPQTNSISTPQGYLIAGNGVSVDQSGTLNVASALGGTVNAVFTGDGLTGGPITVSGTVSLLPATNISLGGIKVGANLLIAADGTLSALPPGTGTISGVIAGSGLSGGGTSGTVNLALNAATTTQLGGVSISPTGGILVSSGTISLAAASQTQVGGIQLASAAEVITGTDAAKAVTPATLTAKTATTARPGIVQLSDSANLVSSTLAATPTAVKAAYDAAAAAQVTANAALPTAGGTMTGIIAFAPGQTFPGVALPKATTSSLGVVQVGSGLAVSVGGILSTINNGTVTGVTAGPGLGAPASGNIITSSGTLRLLPPTVDGVQLGGVKAGDNIQIAYDGTISVPGANFIASNNPYAYNSYLWPIPNPPGPGPIPALPCPGSNGQVLTMLNQVDGTIGWASTGTLSSVVAPIGSGITVSSTPSTATISLTPIPTIGGGGNVGAAALIPTFAVNQYGQLTSIGQANPYTPYRPATVTAPPELVLDFSDNNLHWEWTMQGNVTIPAPLNSQSGQSGYLLITQNPLVPYTITWGSAWKFADGLPYQGNDTLAAVDMVAFTVVSANYIVVTSVTTSLS
jgi:hypothetical protein